MLFRSQRACLRYLLSWVWFLPPIALTRPWDISALETLVLTMGWVAVWALLSRFQPQGQYWHDVWAGTRLIHDDSKPAPPLK